MWLLKRGSSHSKREQKQKVERANKLLAIKNDSPVEGKSLHPLKDRGKSREILDGEGGVHLSGSGDVESLDGVLSVSDVGSDDSMRLDDGPEDVGLDVSVRGHTDTDESSVRSEVLEG